MEFGNNKIIQCVWITAMLVGFCGCAAHKAVMPQEAISYQQGARETTQKFNNVYAGGLYYQKPFIGEVDIPAGYISGGTLRLPGKEYVIYKEGDWVYHVNPELATEQQKKMEGEDVKKQYYSYHSGPVANASTQYSIPEERPAGEQTGNSNSASK